MAEFIGTTNVFEGEVIGRRGADALVRTTAGVAVTTSDAGATSQVALCLRPESIRISAAAGAATAEEIDAADGTIERIIYRGAMTDYHLRLGSGQNLVACRPNDEHNAALAVGALVQASWPAGKARIVRS